MLRYIWCIVPFQTATYTTVLSECGKVISMVSFSSQRFPKMIELNLLLIDQIAIHCYVYTDHDVDTWQGSCHL